MKINRLLLEHMLAIVCRVQHINAKAQPQVESCIIEAGDNMARIYYLVKDGKTSVGHVSAPCETTEAESIPIVDIERLLGILKYHGKTITIFHEEESGKVRIRSGKKRTTMLGTFEAKAYANSQSSISEWNAKARNLTGSITEENTYVTQKGQIINPVYRFTVNSTELYEALRCDGINGQKLNLYNFISDDHNVRVNVGDYLKGKTSTILFQHEDDEAPKFDVHFSGGLENVLKHYSEDVDIALFDFSEYGQGYRMVMRFSNQDLLFQAGVPGV